MYSGIARIELWLLKGFALGFGIVGAANLAQFIENAWFPVLDDWQIAEWHYEGDRDVVLTGTMRKVRQCDYIAPIRVVDQFGVHYRVESRSPTAGQNWATDDGTRQFGPWVVIGGAGQKLRFYTEHQCSMPWKVFSQLGGLDTSTVTGGKRGTD